MTEEEWDSVVKVHLKGHFATMRFAGAYWRQKSKDTGESVNAKIVNTASESGLYGNAGQANYAAAKAGIAAMTIVLARELERFGVRVNCIAPVALTRLTEDLMGGRDGVEEQLAPSNIAAGVAWLASDLSDGVSGQVLKIRARVARADRAGLAAGVTGHVRQGVDDRVDQREPRRVVRQLGRRHPAVPAQHLRPDRLNRLAVQLGWGTDEIAFRDELVAFLDEHAPPEAGQGYDSTDAGAADDDDDDGWSRSGRVAGRPRCSTTAG